MSQQRPPPPPARTHLGRLWRFGAVGASGVIVNTAVLLALAELVGFHPVIAAAIATQIAILTNFTLNDRWTFGDVMVRRSWVMRALRYNAVALGGLAISVLVMAVLYSVAGVHYLGANLVAIGSATGWNYLVNAWLTWTTVAIRPLQIVRVAVRAPVRLAYATVEIVIDRWT